MIVPSEFGIFLKEKRKRANLKQYDMWVAMGNFERKDRNCHDKSSAL